MQSGSRVPLLKTHAMDEILERSLPTPKEQSDLLIRWFAEDLKDYGQVVNGVHFDTHSAIVGARSAEGFVFILRHLVQEGLIARTRRGRELTSSAREHLAEARGGLKCHLFSPF